MARKWRGCLAVLWLVSVVPATLTVAPRVNAGAQADPLGVKKFEEGRIAYDKMNYAAALAAFSVSIELLPSPNTRLYIGRCQRELGQLASALGSLKLAAKEAHDRLVTTGEKRFASTEEAAKEEAAALEVRVPRLKLNLPTPLPAGFVVSIDGRVVPTGAVEAPLELDPGKHVILATAPGYTDFSFNGFASEGETRTIDVTLNRIAAGRLSLLFAARPSGLGVKLDGKPVDPTVVDKPMNLAAGDHTVLVQAPGHDDFVWKGKIADLEDKKLHVKLTATAPAMSAAGPRPGPAPWMTFAVAGAGAVAIGVGAVFAVQAKNLSDAEQAKPIYERTKDERDRVGDLSIRANVLFIGGGVLMVGAGILAATTQWSKPETTTTSASISPVIGPGILGASWVGRF